MSLKNFIRRSHVAYLRIIAFVKKDIEPEGRILIIAPHPDDEVIGCGGLIARLVSKGRTPHIVFMTGGEGSHRGCCNISSAEIIEARRKLTRNALAILGVHESHIHELDFPDGNISIENAAEIDKLKAIIEDIQPETILVPHWGEGWNDHVRSREIGIAVAPKVTAAYEYCVWMWYYNVWRGLDWKNAYRLSMSPREHELKLKAIDAYIKPLAPCGKPWSGVLPELFIKANQWNKELFFKIK